MFAHYGIGYYRVSVISIDFSSCDGGIFFVCEHIDLRLVFAATTLKCDSSPHDLLESPGGKTMKPQRKSIRKSVLVASVAATMATTCIGAASAEETDPKYTLSTFMDAAFGRTVLAGKYEEAISKITTSTRSSTDNFHSMTNLCVAYVMTRDVESAAKACNSAVLQMKEKVADQSRRSGDSAASRARRKYLAIALSNRGVLRAITGETERARKDFREALQLESRIRAPETNLARLSRRSPPNA